jgi:hypothetical protein
MTALRTARIALLTSIALYAVILLLGIMTTGAPDLLLLVSEAAGIAMVVSAIACIVLQIRTAILARRVR